MPKFVVEVPVYVRLTVELPDGGPDAAAREAQAFVEETLTGYPFKMNWPMPAGCIRDQEIVLLDEDDTPDVYDESGRALLYPLVEGSRPFVDGSISRSG